MSNFSEIEKRQPPGNVVVPLAGFADNWDERPNEEVCIGLRFVADQELEDARIEAAKHATNAHPNHAESPETTELWIHAFQDALVRWIIARGTCDPNDVSSPWEGWAAAPEDMVPIALSDQGAQLIFDAWERMRLAANIGIMPATDNDLALLPLLINERLPVLEQQQRASAMRIRRLLRFCLEELEAVTAPPPLIAIPDDPVPE